jgi:Ca-activated chloride channel family protein
MAPSIDDIKLTAYALGELDGTERAAVAAYLAGNEPARWYVAQVRATANLLSDELARESFGGLDELQHAAIEQKLVSALRIGHAHSRSGARRERVIWAMSIAASVLIVFGAISLLLPFVYHRFEKVVAGRARDNDPGGQKFDIVRGTGGPKLPGDHLAVGDPSSVENGGVTDGVFPPPDNRLAMDDPVPEETPLVGAHAADNLRPAPPPAVAHNNAAVPSPADAPRIEPGTAITLIPVGPTRLRPEAYMSLVPYKPGRVKDPAVVAHSSSSETRPADPVGSFHWIENAFVDTSVETVSGFSGGVDTASYSNIRRFLGHNQLPPSRAVHVEEMLNYFPVRTPLPSGDGALVGAVEIGACPWNVTRRLARVCLQARGLTPEHRPPVNLVFVVDISPAMRAENKLPLLKKAMKLLAGRMGPNDRMALIAYSREAGVVLPSTAAEDKLALFAAIDRLDAGGKPVAGQGIETAYAAAASNFITGGVNRVILATDGHWSVGATGSARLADVVGAKAREGISLTVVGVGMENLNDSMMHQLALAGGGNYAYVDTLGEARKVLVDQLNGTLVPAAKDVKVQVRFNAAAVEAYRLIGYERRAIPTSDSESDSLPGGELGAGQSLTALYEVIPVRKSAGQRATDLMTVAVHYRDPSGEAVRTLEVAGQDHGLTLPRNSADFRFAAAVAEFGLLLRDSDYKGNASYAAALERAQESAGPDETGYRQELVSLVRKAKALSAR